MRRDRIHLPAVKDRWLISESIVLLIVNQASPRPPGAASQIGLTFQVQRSKIKDQRSKKRFVRRSTEGMGYFVYK
jgi:hypothetical protein